MNFLNLFRHFYLSHVYSRLTAYVLPCCLLVYLRYSTKPLCSSFTEENGCVFLQVLRMVHESETDSTLVSGTKQIVVHFHNLGSLSDNTAVNNSLIVWLDQGGVMQNHHFCFEVEYCRWLSLLIDKDHTLSEHVALKGLFLH